MQKYGMQAMNDVPSERAPCLVCDDPHPSFSWTDFSGEGYCVQCGTPYQLKWGTLKDGETYPRVNVSAEWIPIFRKFWNVTHSSNGAGTFMLWREYPDQERGRIAFNAWCDAHEDELPKKPNEEATSVDAVDPPDGRVDDGPRA